MTKKIAKIVSKKTQKNQYIDPWNFFKYLSKQYQDLICKHQNNIKNHENHEKNFFEQKFYPIFYDAIRKEDFKKIEQEKEIFLKYQKLEEDLKIYKNILKILFNFKISLPEEDFQHQDLNQKIEQINEQRILNNKQKKEIIEQNVEKNKNQISYKIELLKFHITCLKEYTNILIFFREQIKERKVKIKSCEQIVKKNEEELNRLLSIESLQNIRMIAVNSEKTLKKMQDSAKNSENATMQMQYLTKMSLLLIFLGTVASVLVMLKEYFQLS